MDVNVVFSCLNAYYKPKVVCNIYSLVEKVTSGIKTADTEIEAKSEGKGTDVASPVNVKVSLAAASLILLHPDNSSYPLYSVTMSKTDFGLKMLALS